VEEKGYEVMRFPVNGLRVVFWQNMPSIQQSALIKALSLRDDFRVVWAVAHELNAGRVQMGWPMPDTGKAELILGPTQRQAEELLFEDESNSLHIFTMHHHPRGLRILFKAFTRCLTTTARMALMGEGTAFGSGIRTFPRMVLDAYYRFRWPERVGFILAQGPRAMTWFSRCGYAKEKLFPFGFFIEKPADGEPAELAIDPTTYVIVFIGMLIHRKGLDVLLKALANITQFSWRLIIVGEGEKRQELSAMAQRLDIAKHVDFRGNLPNSEALALLRAADLFVLPTRNDTWGVVVNEALFSGIPVVCSDMCGAEVLLSTEDRGYVFKSDDVNGLHETLLKCMKRGKTDTHRSERIRNWSTVIEGPSVAEYVFKIIDWAYFSGPRPVPPWMD
jgi:glycosyltransferase involved in cell wall biosynthesis